MQVQVVSSTEVVRADQTAQDTDVDLKELHVGAIVEYQMVGNPVASLVVLVHEPSNQQSVQAVDNGQAKIEPGMWRLGQHIDLVMAPGILPAGQTGERHSQLAASQEN